MEECGHQKIICSYGHSSGTFLFHEPLPKKCPQCGQLYDEQEHRPVLCFEDGSVPQPNGGETGKTEIKEEFSEHQNTAPIPTGSSGMIKPIKSRSSLQRRAGHAPRKTEPDSRILGHTGAKRQTPSVNGSIQSLGKMSAAQREKPTSRRNPAVSSGIDRGLDHKQLDLITGGTHIDIPKEGAFLGRDGLGRESFCLNPLVSRKHVFVQNGQSGILCTRCGVFEWHICR